MLSQALVTLAPMRRFSFAGEQRDPDTAVTIIRPQQEKNFHSGDTWGPREPMRTESATQCQGNFWSASSSQRSSPSKTLPTNGSTRLGRLAAYLQEMAWHFNNRKNPLLFRNTSLSALPSENLEYKRTHIECSLVIMALKEHVGVKLFSFCISSKRTHKSSSCSSPCAGLTGVPSSTLA